MKKLILIAFFALSACAPPDNSTNTGGAQASVDPDTQTGTSPVYDTSISSLQNGNFIYELSRQSCSNCHGYYGEGQSNGLNIQQVTFAQMTAALTATGNGMPTYNLNDQQKSALYEYIQSLTASQ